MEAAAIEMTSFNETVGADTAAVDPVADEDE